MYVNIVNDKSLVEASDRPVVNSRKGKNVLIDVAASVIMAKVVISFEFQNLFW